jgi:hypothetical protein
MNLKIISGGQSGTDQAALRAAKAAGLPTGGFAPKGWLTEDGPVPWLREFGLVESEPSSYAARTRLNVTTADATLVFDCVESQGTNLTYRECDRQKKPFRGILMERVGKDKVRLCCAAIPPEQITDWIQDQKIRILNVAGNRESKAPGIGERVERFLGVVFGLLARDRK